ncbi:MAG: phage tail assembly protein [Leptolyngbyaceae cyanobacterium CSU_1_4]|nr:phage tail assembly protein [Leptolyngbyaceae cyanobacterium CSU_1_4]
MSNLAITQFNFQLPRGLVDEQGNRHQQGTMRLATARDEIFLQKNRQGQENSAYGSLVMLARVITRLGDRTDITPELLENLFTLDLAFLREFYNRINQEGDATIPVSCPACKQQFTQELTLSGE